MAEQLTPSQKLAVENRGGKLLVSAAAGSGKTKVLVDRLLSYLTDKMVPANLDDFLIITYTKAAAAELRGKISDKLTSFIADHPHNRHMQQQIQRLHMAKISTVHAFCADILRQYAYLLDIPADFRIAEDSECQEMMGSVLEKLLDSAYGSRMDDPSFRAFVDSQGLGRDDRQVPEIILQIYSSALCHLDPIKWLDQCVEDANVKDITDVGQTRWGSYLIEDLKEYLSLQIKAIENCIEQAELSEGYEKPVTVLSATLLRLKQLRDCEAWDQIANCPPIPYGVLTFKKDQRGSDLAERIKSVRSHCKEGLAKKLRAFRADNDAALDQLRQAALSACGIVDLVKDFRIQYDALKRARRVMDFSDIEQKTLDLLLGKQRTGPTAAAREISARFREIMVDEYQDSNAVQDAIFCALTHERKNCFMVGDVKQSIYQFRLADPSIFLEKYNSYKAADTVTDDTGRKVMLSSNFRSSGGVISAVNDVFQTCMSVKVGGLSYGADEMLYEGLAHIPLAEPEVELYGVDVRDDTYREEACFVASRIRKLLDGNHQIRDGADLRPIQPQDIVILLRSPGSVGGEFSYALEEAGIHCSMGNGGDLLQLPHIESLCSILQVIHNPVQDIPLLAALAGPVFGFTADDLARIRIGQRHTDFYSALNQDDSEKSRSFLEVLHTLRNDARFLSVTQLIHKIFLLTNMLGIYGAMPDGDILVQDLQEFCQMASAFEDTGRKDLSCFLDYLEAMRVHGFPVEGADSGNCVRIMSIHKSKGLEFPVVFLCGLSRSFNMTDTTKAVLCHKDLGLGLTCVNQTQRVRFPTVAKRAIAARITADTVSEEMRVLYVAMTRARDRLIMTYAAPKLKDRLQDIVLRMDMCDADLLTAYAACPGTWVLYTALRRTEAGAFFQLAGYPECVSARDIPWHIRVVEAPLDGFAAVDTNTDEAEQLPQTLIEKIRRGLTYQYPHYAAVTTPSKLTATQLKGRIKDQEAAEYTKQERNRVRSLRAAGTNSQSSGIDYGNTMHTLMQYIDYSACQDADSVAEQVRLLVDKDLLSSRQAEYLDIEGVVDFFSSELGTRIRNGREVLREFKFSVLEKADAFVPGTEGEAVLLQGVVDCALIEADKITIVDFKTDAVTEATVHSRTQQYVPQVTTYANALKRIYEQPNCAAYLYYFRIKKLIRVI